MVALILIWWHFLAVLGRFGSGSCCSNPIPIEIIVVIIIKIEFRVSSPLYVLLYYFQFFQLHFCSLNFNFGLLNSTPGTYKLIANIPHTEYNLTFANFTLIIFASGCKMFPLHLSIADSFSTSKVIPVD